MILIALTQIIPDRAFKRELNKALIWCTNFYFGCNVQMEYKDLAVST
jgi:hypothetical protein